MKQMKQTLCLLLALVMLVGMLPMAALGLEAEEILAEENYERAEAEVPDAYEEVTEELAPDAEAPEAEETEEPEPTEATVVVTDEEAQEVKTYLAAQPTKPADGTVTGNPFAKGNAGSTSFRIPALATLSDGTLIAAADARWNSTYDGGGADTIVARSSDNGANWNYTFANYLGDNGNVYNGSASTDFVDPALAVKNDTIYMLVDLYPYGVALNGSGNTQPITTQGFDANGNLKLSTNGYSYNYYLKDGQIYNSSNTVVSGYTVDGYFNLYQDGSYVSNLFFSDSPYKVVRTGYLYLTKSSDKGASWSEPLLIPNVKTATEQVCLVGPGNGTVLSDGTIVFSIYRYNGESDKVAGFIYSTDDGATWQRSDWNINGTSESVIVEVNSNLLRVFYRSASDTLWYVDVTKNGSSYTWGFTMNTGVACTNDTEKSALLVHGDDEDYILVSCPGNATSGHSGSDRKYGRIYTFRASDMALVNTVNVPSVHSNDSFMYSCMSLLPDGDVALLYEDNENGWGVGDDKYYEMSYTTYTLSQLGITLPDPSTVVRTVTDPDSGVSVKAKGIQSIDVRVSDSTGPEDRGVTISYDITPDAGYVQGTEAEVTIPVHDYLAHKLIKVIDTATKQTLSAVEKDGSIVFTTNHFSTYDTAEEIIELTVGETSGIFYVSHDTFYGSQNVVTDDGIVQVNQAGTAATEAGISYTGPISITAGELGASSTNYTKTNYHYYVNGQYYPLYIRYYSNSYKDYFYIGYSTTGQSGNVTQIDSYLYTTATVNVYTEVTTAGSPASTTVQFTGLTAGETLVEVGDKEIQVIVNPAEYQLSETLRKDATLTLAPQVPDGGSVSFRPNVGAAYVDVVTKEDDANQATVTGNQVGIARVDAVVKDANGNLYATYYYTIEVVEYPVTEITLTLAKYTDTELSVPLQDGQTVVWSSANSSIAGVGKVYNQATPTNKAILLGNDAGQAAITALVKDADGRPVAAYEWAVTVTDAADINTSSRYIYVDVTQIENCTVYYAINGGELIEIADTGILIDEQKTGHFNIMFFAAPDEGYALTYMSVSGSAKQYYVLSNGNPDGTGSDAWPFNSVTQTTIPTNSNDSQWKTVNGALHGFRWGLMQGNMTINRMKAMFAQAIELGCDGVSNFTKNDQNGHFYTEVQFVAEPLPTIKKEIVSITHNKGQSSEQTEAFVVGSKIALGDTVNYKITVTKPAYLTGPVVQDSSYTSTSPITDSNKPSYSSGNYGAITYSNAVLTDELTNNAGLSNPALGTSGAEAQTYTYNTSLTVTMNNYGEVVQNGAVVNTANLAYNYQSQYSSGKSAAVADAKARIEVKVPEYVVDFSLPVEIHLAADVGTVTVASGTAEYGTVTPTATGFTYTLTRVMASEDYVDLTLSNGQHYGVRMYPATSVYYEENIMTTDGFTSAGSSLNLKQTAQQAGLSTDEYGRDGAYSTVGASNGTWLTSSSKGEEAAFTFTGTGFELYSINSADTGLCFVMVQNANGKYIKIAAVNTAGVSTLYSELNGVTRYNMPIVSLAGLTHGTYTVTVVNADGGPIHLDGFRVYGTLKDEPAFYIRDREDKPVYYELRDAVLVAGSNDITVSGDEQEETDYDYAQVYQKTVADLLDGDYSAVLIPGDALDADKVQAMLDHGPKNELYLLPGDSITFYAETDREVQLGLKAVNAAASVRVTTGAGTEVKSIPSTTVMFYTVKDAGVAGTITITNTGTGVLSVTKAKICDDPSAALKALSEDDLADTLEALGLMTKGDADGNGQLTLVDVAQAFRLAVGDNQTSPYLLKLLDMNGDGKLNVMDVSLLYARYTGG